MQISTVTAKGQVTIPRRIREQLRLEKGTRLLFRISEDGRLILEPIRDDGVAALGGLLGHLAKDEPVSTEEMNAAVRDRARTRGGR